LSDDQRALLDFLLTRDFPGRPELARQAQTVMTGGSSCSCGCPSFSLIADRTLPAADVSYADRMVSDADGADPAGNMVGVLLFTDGGYLDDVEVFSYEDSTFAGLPRPESLTLNEWSEPDDDGNRCAVDT
jgi:hypothetical protein